MQKHPCAIHPSICTSQLYVAIGLEFWQRQVEKGEGDSEALADFIQETKSKYFQKNLVKGGDRWPREGGPLSPYATPLHYPTLHLYIRTHLFIPLEIFSGVQHF